ncbi:Calcineurin-like phosphoesterase-like protein 9 [Elsinoe fawcettii]|nr:Calcineurin-like phosphoesterase-like protein 9 [Elsinoe fawcettii]
MRPTALSAGPIVTDLTLCYSTQPPTSANASPKSRTWRRVNKELYLDSSSTKAWVYIAIAGAEELEDDDLFVTDIQVGERPHSDSASHEWESRAGGIWVLRSQSPGDIDRAVTDVEVLFGRDAVDPRPRWALSKTAIQLVDQPCTMPAARLTVLHGRAGQDDPTRPTLRVRDDGTFRIVQISDTHMVAGVGTCNDAMDVAGTYLDDCEADPLTVRFIGEVLDIERPDLVILTGDQVHHDALDSQTALFKVTTPIITRSIPFAAVFGNHDDEGDHALSRLAQTSLLQSLPFSLCERGPNEVDGVSNFYLNISDRVAPHESVLTLFLVDSHGQIESNVRSPDYAPITKSQIEWFVSSCRERRAEQETKIATGLFSPLLVFQHIPLPEFEDEDLDIRSGHRREPSEGPTANSHFYNALVEQGIAA